MRSWILSTAGRGEKGMYQWFTAGLPDTFLVKLLNMSMTAGITIVAVMLVRVLLRKAPKIFSYALWGIVLFRLLCPVSISSGFSAFAVLDQARAEQTVVPSPGSMADPVIHEENHSAVEVTANQSQSPSVPPAQNPSFVIYEKEAARIDGEESVVEHFWNEERVLTLFYGIWGAGVAVLMSVNLVTLWRLKRRTSVCLPLRGNVFLCDQVDTLGGISSQDLSALVSGRAGEGIHSSPREASYQTR